MNHRTLFVAVAAAAALVAAAPAIARTKKRKVKPAKVALVEAPLGLLGRAGAGSNVTIPFRLRDSSRRPTNVEIQYGVDRDGDGTIAEAEYRPATEDRFAPQSTRHDRAPQLYSTGADAAQAIVWKSGNDLARGRFVAGPQYLLDAQGRPVVDAQEPTQFVVDTINPGVRIRLRAVSSSGHRSDWGTSGPVSVDDDQKPSLTIDQVAVANDGSRVVVVDWTAFDPDSEDFNANGALDIALGEDVNANGELDDERVGVAFDWHRLAPGENPATMTVAQLGAVLWLPCARDESSGDADSITFTPGEEAVGGLPSAPPGVGRSYVFAWDSQSDVGPSIDSFILRATPIDEHRSRGATVYSRVAFRPAD